MELILNRTTFSTESTIGTLSRDGIDICKILEDTDRHLESNPSAKIYGKTAIPRGRYRIVATMSQRFARVLPLLLNVPGYEGVRIHPGNTPADTDGCLLPGLSSSVDFVASSRAAWLQVNELITSALDRHEEVWITIK